MSIVNARGLKPESSPSVKPSSEPFVFVGGVSPPGEFVIKGPPPQPHPPLKASTVVGGLVRGQSRRVSVRPRARDVDKSIREIRTRHLRPAPPVAPARIHDSAADSPVVVKPAGWVAEPPTYPRKLGATPFTIRPKSLILPFKEPKPEIVMPRGIIYGSGAGASDEPLVILPVEDNARGPVEVKIHEFTFANHKTHKVELK